MASGDLVIALDPGQSSGLAVFGGGNGLWHLLEAFQGTPAEVADWAIHFARGSGTSTSLTLVVERPQIYAQGRGGKVVNPTHMLDLYGQARELFGRVSTVRGVGYPRAVPTLVEYLPAEWKGQVPKSKVEAESIHHLRILDALESWEQGLLPPAGKRYDCLDAVGLGLFHVGRTGRGGTPPCPP